MTDLSLLSKFSPNLYEAVLSNPKVMNIGGSRVHQCYCSSSAFEIMEAAYQGSCTSCMPSNKQSCADNQTEISTSTNHWMEHQRGGQQQRLVKTRNLNMAESDALC